LLTPARAPLVLDLSQRRLAHLASRARRATRPLRPSWRSQDLDGL